MTQPARVGPLQLDVLNTETGEHRYWSTHCRHGNHEACSATEIMGPLRVGARGSDGRYPVTETRVPREPAQCKTCAAPCICDCHATASTSRP